MTIWLGVDLVEVGEVEASLAAFGEKYLRRMFTPGELEDCAGDARRLAVRVAAKEAVLKALRLLGDSPTPLHDVELVSGQDGPRVLLSGVIAAAAAERGWGTPTVSLSHTDCHAVAVVVAMSTTSAIS